MSNIRTRLERLEKRQNGTSFSFWDCLAGLKPPPGWQPPEDIAKALAELPDSVPDHVEDLITRMDDSAPLVAEPSIRDAFSSYRCAPNCRPNSRW